MDSLEQHSLEQHSLEQQITLMQLADSFFPSGAYTLSHGLESLVQSGQIASAQAVETFISLLLCNKISGTDLVALAHTYAASDRNDFEKIIEVDALLYAQTPIEKTRLAQRQSGRALLMVARQTWPHPQLEQTSLLAAQGNINCLHPVIFAIVAYATELTQQQALTAFVHGFVTGLLGAAIRLGAMGHLQAQQVRRSLSADMVAVCKAAIATPLDEMWSCTPTIDLAQMKQARLSRRLFAS